VGAGAGAAVLAGCGTAAPTSAPAAPTTAPAAAAPTVIVPKRSGELIVALGEDWQQLDPHLQSRIAAFNVHSQMYESLFKMNAKDQVEPLLAESATNIDNLTWEIKLREGIKFHNGEDFDGESVKFSLERFYIADWVNSYKNYWPQVEIEVLDKYKVRMKTPEPWGLFLQMCTITLMVPASAADHNADEQYWLTQPVGTGPFKLAEYEKGQHILLEANDSYWRPDLPKVERLRYRFISEMSTRMAAVMAGEVHVADRVPPDMIKILETSADLKMVSRATAETQYIGFNCSREYFKDPRVRQAFNYAVDKKKLVNDLLLGNGMVADGCVAPPVFGYSQQTPFEQDVEKAKSLMAEAGYGSGFPDVSLIILKGVYTKALEVCEAIAGMLKEIGVNVQVEDVEPAVHWPRRRDGEFDMAFVGWANAPCDADYTMKTFWYAGPTDQGNYQDPEGTWYLNWLRYRNPDVDVALKQGRENLDPKVRAEGYANAAKLIWPECSWLWLYFTQMIDVANKKVSGFVQTPGYTRYFEETVLSS